MKSQDLIHLAPGEIATPFGPTLLDGRPHNATWRGVSPVCSCCGHMEISFELPVAGQAKPMVLRLSVPAASMASAMGAVADYLGEPTRQVPPRCKSCATHSGNSSGSPIRDVSTKAEFEKQ
jgi:hypothetical protein